nr:ATP-dependent RNA helicase A-like protein [Ipomoea batatas]
MEAQTAASRNVTEGPVLCVIKQAWEDSLFKVKTLNKEQEETLYARSRTFLAGIEELQKIRQPLARRRRGGNRSLVQAAQRLHRRPPLTAQGIADCKDERDKAVENDAEIRLSRKREISEPHAGDIFQGPRERQLLVLRCMKDDDSCRSASRKRDLDFEFRSQLELLHFPTCFHLLVTHRNALEEMHRAR